MAQALRDRGLRVWYSGDKLGGGKSIAREINEAIAKSSYCVAVLSPSYLESEWTMTELWAYFAKENRYTQSDYSNLAQH